MFRVRMVSAVVKHVVIRSRHGCTVPVLEIKFKRGMRS